MTQIREELLEHKSDFNLDGQDYVGVSVYTDFSLYSIALERHSSLEPRILSRITLTFKNNPVTLPGLSIGDLLEESRRLPDLSNWGHLDVVLVEARRWNSPLDRNNHESTQPITHKPCDEYHYTIQTARCENFKIFHDRNVPMYPGYGVPGFFLETYCVDRHGVAPAERLYEFDKAMNENITPEDYSTLFGPRGDLTANIVRYSNTLVQACHARRDTAFISTLSTRDFEPGTWYRIEFNIKDDDVQLNIEEATSAEILPWIT